MSTAHACLVIPVYNEEQVVGEVVRECRATFSKVVCVNDGSRDASGEVAAAAGATVVNHPFNLGQGAALQTGIEFALLDPSVEVVVTFDADGQHRVEDAVRLVEALDRRDVDVVFGSRFLDERTDVGRVKRAVLKLAVRYTNSTSGLQLTDAHNGLRAMRRAAASTLDLRMHGMAHASEIVEHVARHKLRYAEEPVVVRYTAYSRAKGQSVLNSVNILFDLFFKN